MAESVDEKTAAPGFANPAGAKSNAGTMPGLVSVIIPAYNHEKYVRPAIRSVIGQTYPHLELLVLDDGSPDGTWQAVKSLEEDCRARFQRVKFFRQENQGIWDTLNHLLAEARGEYILRLDSDDLIKPGSVEKLLNFLHTNEEYVLAVGDNEIIDENGEVVSWTFDRRNTVDPDEAVFGTFGQYLRFTRPELDFNSEDFGRHETLWGNYVPNGYLVRAKFMDKVVFSKQAPREDYYMMFQLAKAGRFKFFDEILHSYRWHAANNIKDRAKDLRYTNLTRKYELRLLKNDGDMERYARLFEALVNWKKRVKLKLGGWLELYRVMDIFDERKLYQLRLGSRTWPLFELSRENTTARTPWRPRAAWSPEEFDF